MNRFFWTLTSVFICIQLAGCSGWAMRASTSRQARVDQGISGNRGFISGRPASAPKQPTFTDRRVYRVEVELPDLLPRKKSLSQPVRPPKEDKEIWGNKGYISGGPKQETEEKMPHTWKVGGQPIEEVIKEEPQIAGPASTYQVRKGDTLQKISQQFYGTTKKWPLLYQANKDKLKTADKVYPGQILVIPKVGEFKK